MTTMILNNEQLAEVLAKHVALWDTKTNVTYGTLYCGPRSMIKVQIVATDGMKGDQAPDVRGMLRYIEDAPVHEEVIWDSHNQPWREDYHRVIKARKVGKDAWEVPNHIL